MFSNSQGSQSRACHPWKALLLPLKTEETLGRGGRTVQAAPGAEQRRQSLHGVGWHLSSAIREGNEDEVIGNRESGAAFSEGLAPWEMFGHPLFSV